LAESVQHQELVKPFPPPVSSGGSEPQCQLSTLVSAFAAADDVAACREVNGMLRLAIELVRDRLGLERAGLYIRDRGCPRIILRGTFGTGARGETTDERALYHEVEPRDFSALLGSRLSGGLGMLSAQSPLFAVEPGRIMVIGQGWVMATPLVAGRDLVGVMYNDAAFTHSAVDEGKQAAAAVFCTLLGVLYQSRRRGVIWQPLPSVSGQSSLIERILRTLNEDLPITGERLAGELGVSAGHLARAFKREMGVSLVDYRNRKRLDRFFEIIQRMGNTSNLLDAALEAGFGSYAQFHRVYRKFLGTTPRAMFSATDNEDAATALGRLGPLGAGPRRTGKEREPEPD
jgi:AraC-like DNA-binding protein